MYHIVASDLDGTLLSPDNTLSSWAKETLKFVINKGVNFVFATGRHYMDVKRILNNLKIKAYTITSNGARVHDINDKLISSHNLEHDIVVELFRMMYNNKEITTNVYRDDEWIMNCNQLKKTTSLTKEDNNYIIYDPNLIDFKGVSKVFFTCDNYELLLSLEQIINDRWHKRVNASFSASTCLEIMAGGVSKGHALIDVVKRLGYEMKDCIAFGDGMNDAEMLSMVGKGCIMGNAHQRLKDLYPWMEVIGTNADNAVPYYLSKLYLE